VLSARDFESLLPWYLNGTLTDRERALVAAYLEAHPEEDARVQWNALLRAGIKKQADDVPEDLGLDRVLAAVRPDIPWVPSPWRARRRRLDRAIIVALTLVLAYVMIDKFWPIAEKERATEASPAATVQPSTTASTLATPATHVVVPAAATLSAATAPAAPPTSATAPAASVPVPLRPETQGPGSGAEAVATIVGGPVLFIRGASRFAAAPGVRLGGGDIIATGADAELQLEFEGGTRLDLGPLTSLMLLPEEAGSPPRHVVYLQAGWLKLTAAAPPARVLDALRTARFELTLGDNVTVTRLDGEEASVFAEQGNARILERRRGSSATEVALRAGQFYSRRAQLAGSVLARPSPQFVKQLPPQFLEALPSRIDAFRGRAVAAKPASDFTYAEVEPWLKADAPIRRQLVERWKDKAHEPAFRRALEANLRDLPEWQPILYPRPPPGDSDAHAPNAPPVAKSPPS
jgi:hypothetical protein